MGVYKYDAINDILVPIAGTSAQGIEDKVSTYTADSSYWDTAPSDSSTKPLTSGAIYTALSGKAPTSHASKETTYGVASDVDYGHVKTGVGITNSSGTISVSYGSAAGTACEGNDSRLSDVRVPSSHASSDVNTYGGGNASNYGHVKLTDSYNTSSSVAAVNSVGASGKAVYDSYMLKTNQAVIATRQANLTASRRYEFGDQFIYNNELYKVTATAGINQNTSINTGSSGNASKADNITTQIGKLQGYTLISATGTNDLDVSNITWHKGILEIQIMYDGNPYRISVSIDNFTEGTNQYYRYMLGNYRMYGSIRYDKNSKKFKIGEVIFDGTSYANKSDTFLRFLYY